MFIPADRANRNAAPQQSRYAVLPIALVAAVWLAACGAPTEPEAAPPERHLSASHSSARPDAPAASATRRDNTPGAQPPADTLTALNSQQMIWW